MAQQVPSTEEHIHPGQIMEAYEAGDVVAIHDLLLDLHPAEIADVIEAVPLEHRKVIWSCIEPLHKGEVLVELSEGVRASLINVLEDNELVDATLNLDTDDIADLIPLLSSDVQARVLFALDARDRQHLDRVLAYPEDTAGGLMNVDAVVIREDVSLEVVLRYLRRLGQLPEYTNKLFVVDRHGKMVGNVIVSRLLTGDPALMVHEVMEEVQAKFSAMAPDSEVAAVFERLNLVSAPVVDDNDHILGRITIDDVVDVIREQAGHSVMAPAGLSEDEDIFAPVGRSARARALWLGVNLLTAIFASWVIGFFEGTIEKVVALAVLMPIVASMGGNAGTQTVTLVVRGMALGTVAEHNARKVLVRELMVSVLNSFVWAVVMGTVAALWYHNLMLAAVMGLAMAVNLVVAALSGVLIPLLVRRIGVDPALASGVALTTVTDVVGFFVFLGLATLILI